MIKAETVNGKNNIVFFDGQCVLCNSSVHTLIKIDKNRKLRYSSLQGAYAKQVLEPKKLSGSSVIFWRDGKIYERAEAVIQIFETLGGIYKPLSKFLKLFPRAILNCAYDFVARHRYKIFGRHDACMIPSPEIKDLFV